MTKHTPGPWHLQALVNHADGVLDIRDCLVASVYNPNVELQGANARLIAAAPELLEAAKVARKRLERVKERDGSGVEALTVLDLVIAKAEGRE